jgi:hypothetical protein
MNGAEGYGDVVAMVSELFGRLPHVSGQGVSRLCSLL